MEHGVLTYVKEAAWGDMKDLLEDVGITKNSVEYFNLAASRQAKEQFFYNSDENFHYLMNAMFTPVDMTDYETAFVGWNDLPGSLPINRQSWLKPLIPEPTP